ncbi:hypothetical protein C8Q80DRAFT_249514 [Daedaleopsis nitida]|nr:hypothetical protein C8Q80DRAFT_249514 [Daedaleopsis nitida]
MYTTSAYTHAAGGSHAVDVPLAVPHGVAAAASAAEGALLPARTGARCTRVYKPRLGGGARLRSRTRESLRRARRHTRLAAVGFRGRVPVLSVLISMGDVQGITHAASFQTLCVHDAVKLDSGLVYEAIWCRPPRVRRLQLYQYAWLAALRTLGLGLQSTDTRSTELCARSGRMSGSCITPADHPPRAFPWPRIPVCMLRQCRHSDFAW